MPIKETFLEFRARLQRMPTLTEAHLAALYAACAEEGMTEYARGLYQEDAS